MELASPVLHSCPSTLQTYKPAELASPVLEFHIYGGDYQDARNQVIIQHSKYGPTGKFCLSWYWAHPQILDISVNRRQPNDPKERFSV